MHRRGWQAELTHRRRLIGEGRYPRRDPSPEQHKNRVSHTVSFTLKKTKRKVVSLAAAVAVLTIGYAAAAFIS